MKKCDFSPHQESFASQHSSILKASKLRQSFDNMEGRRSSIENSPGITEALKIKRRVSFAEKKHVKEFCDSIEQGTIWDKTYEESELSQTKNSRTSNTDGITVCDKEVHESSNSSVSNENECFELSEPETIMPDNISDLANTEIMDSIHGDESKEREYDLHLINSTTMAVNTGPLPIIEHPKMMIFHGAELEDTSKAVKQITCLSQTAQPILVQSNMDSFLYGEKEKNCPSKIKFMRDSMNERSVLESRLNQIQFKKICEIPSTSPNSSMDFTDIPLNIACIDNQQRSAWQLIPKYENLPRDRTKIFQAIKNVEKLFTSPTERSLLCHNNINQFAKLCQTVSDTENSQQVTSDKTIMFHNISLDLTNTSSVEKSNISSPQKNREIHGSTIVGDQSLDLTEGAAETTRHSKLVDLTDASLLYNTSMDITRVVPSVLKGGDNGGEGLMTPSKKNLIACMEAFSDPSPKTMHPISQSDCLSECSTVIGNRSISSPIVGFETIMCHDESMELTSAIQSSLQRSKDNSSKTGPQKSMQNLSKFVTEQESMIYSDKLIGNTEEGKYVLRPKITSIQNEKDYAIRTEDLQLCHNQLFRKEDKFKCSDNDVIQAIESVTSLLSQESDKSSIDTSNADEQLSMDDSDSKDISEVISKNLETVNDNLNNCNSNGSVTNRPLMVFGSEAIQLFNVMVAFSLLQENGEYQFPLQLSQVPQKDNVTENTNTISNTEEKYHSLSVMKKNVSKTLKEKDNSEELLLNSNTTINNLAEKFSLSLTAKYDRATSLSQLPSLINDRLNLMISTISPAKSFVFKTFIAGVNSNVLDTHSVEAIERTNRQEPFVVLKNLDVTTTKNNDGFTNIDCGSSKRPLEEIGCRVYSVSNFRPKDTCIDCSEEIIGYRKTVDNSIIFKDLHMQHQNSFGITDNTKRKVTIADEFCNEVVEHNIRTGNRENCTEHKKTYSSQKYVERNISDETLRFISLSIRYCEGPDKEIKNQSHPHTAFKNLTRTFSKPQNSDVIELFCNETIVQPNNSHSPSTSMELLDTWNNEKFTTGAIRADNVERQLISLNKDLINESLSSINVFDNNAQITDALKEKQCFNHLVLLENDDKEQYASNERNYVTEFSFLILKRTLESLSKRSQTIWNINRLDEKNITFNFSSQSIVLAIHLNGCSHMSKTDTLQKVVLSSQLVKARTDPTVCLAHCLIMEKIDSSSQLHSYRTVEEIPQLLEYVSLEVKLGMDFISELEYLRDHNIMEIYDDRIFFLARTRKINAGIIVNVTVQINVFERIDYRDISVFCLLGKEKIKKMDIKKLITNVKKDHRFLRFYMADVQNYIDLMAETDSSINTN